MNVIGLHGKKRRGKDTVAKFAAELLGGDYKIISPADKLKELACEALGMSYEGTQEALKIMEDCKDTWTITATKPGAGVTLWDGHTIPTIDIVVEIVEISARQLLQYLGNGAREVFGKDFWVDQTLPKPGHYFGEDMQRAERMHGLNLTGNLFIPSVRYENEAERIRAYKGVVIEVVRTDMPDDDDFVSEQRLPEHLIDWTIVNDGDLGELRQKTAEALEELGLLS